MVPTEKKGIKIAAQNRKAYHDYFVEDKYEAGIELCGTEVKSIRAGTMNLKDSYCTVQDGELFVHSMHISPYEHGNIFNRDPDRDRRLLMHKREIRKLHALVKQDGYTLVPLSVYFKNAKVKVEVVVSRVPVRSVIDVTKQVLYTGHIGDGKIFVYNVENVVKVRTGEEGVAALQDTH